MTPGVYTVEKSAFPPSVGEVPTAIPAFVCYTEKAEQDGKSLHNIPTLINSLSEYNQYFGGAPLYQFPINIVVNTADPTKPPLPGTYDFVVGGATYYKVGNATLQGYYNYNCLRMFYLNGGGQAYIVSVGKYDRGPDTADQIPVEADLLAGLELLKTIQFPKPTMILIPDALAIDMTSNVKNMVVQQQMIAQAGELMDRVAILDVWNGYEDLQSTVIPQFRESVGVSYLSYAIAYYPWLECAVVDDSEITAANLYRMPAPAGASGFEPTSTDPQYLGQVIKGYQQTTTLVTLSADLKNIESDLYSPSLKYDGQTAAAAFSNWQVAFDGAPGTGTNPTVERVGNQTMVLAEMFDTLFLLGNSNQTTALQNNFGIQFKKLANAVKNLTNPIGALATTMVTLAGMELAFDPTTKSIGSKLSTWFPADSTATPPVTTPVATVPAGFENAKTEAGAEILYPLAEPTLKQGFTELMSALNLVQSMAETLIDQNNASLVNSSSDYKNMMTAVAKQANILPPSGAMAGIYSLIDNSRGVWYSPANVNVDAVVAPTVVINDAQQASLNVDVLAGKSINAIRSFYGRGPSIVWGARTLDGNSLDYRYINVRRTLIMIEQSVANAAFSVVFEPNNANTWVVVKGMISNFLSGLWSDGALIGGTTADAFDVQVGLGQTMTPLDLLNGIMRISVKLAIVRPAEFIIITYEQEMAKSG